MLFNPDPNKQALEVLFSQKRDKENYPPLTFNGDKVQSVPCQKTFRFNFRLKTRL